MWRIYVDESLREIPKWQAVFFITYNGDIQEHEFEDGNGKLTALYHELTAMKRTPKTNIGIRRIPWS